MVVASHDRYLVERVTDHVYGMFGDGRLRHLPGGVDEYLDRAGATAGTAAADRAGPGGATVSGRSAAGGGATAGRGGPAAPLGGDAPPMAGEGPSGGPSPAETRAARKDLARLERALARLQQRADRLHLEMAEHATDFAKIAALDEQLKAVAAEQAETEEAWLAAAEVAGDG
jgi:hypothetical protein